MEDNVAKEPEPAPAECNIDTTKMEILDEMMQHWKKRDQDNDKKNNSKGKEVKEELLAANALGANVLIALQLEKQEEDLKEIKELIMSQDVLLCVLDQKQSNKEALRSDLHCKTKEIDAIKNKNQSA